MTKNRKTSEYDNMPDLLVLSIQTIGMDPFDKLIELCEPITYSIIKKYFFQDYEREDFLQEARSVLVKATYDWRVDKGMEFTQYYHMQLSNHLNMLVRKNHAQKRIVNLNTSSLDCLVEEAGVHIQGTASLSSQPEEKTIAHETFSNYLLELSKLESAVLKLHFQGLAYDAISQTLKITLDQARSALYRCRVKLSKKIDQR